MSTSIIDRSQGLSGFEPTLTERNANRFHGMTIVVGASLALWGIIGATIWGIVSVVNL